jgi:hypothetical protein
MANTKGAANGMAMSGMPGISPNGDVHAFVGKHQV